MRKIKFRAWYRGKMADVVEISFEIEDMKNTVQLCKMEIKRIGKGKFKRIFHECRARIKDVELMQYTGLKDKNDVEIYEGDIVENSKGHKFLIYFDNTECGFRQTTNFKKPQIKNETYTNLPLNWNLLEVIGNKYEDDDLLEEIENE